MEQTKDAVEFLRGLPSGHVDLILTDPAYASLDKHRKVGTTTRLKKKWFPTVPNDYFDPWFREAFRVLADNSHCYVMCDSETMFEIVPLGRRAGFTFWKPLVWDKMSIGMGYHYRAQCEFILFFEKGKRRLLDLGMGDVFQEKRLKGEAYYPTEKPVRLLEKFVLQSTTPGERVCDPFMGAGSVGEAALKHGREFLGCDADESAVPLASERLQKFKEGRR